MKFQNFPIKFRFTFIKNEILKKKLYEKQCLKHRKSSKIIFSKIINLQIKDIAVRGNIKLNFPDI